MSKNQKVVEPVEQDDTYQPSPDESFMNPRQLAYFQKRLIEWRDQLLQECSSTIHYMQEHKSEADILDAAANELNHTIELKTRDRERKLINKIDDALKRIEDGSYGYCMETGEPINLQRLKARPIATLSLEAQERHEREERSYKD